MRRPRPTPVIPLRKPKPVTVARLEAALDRYAWMMARSRNPHLGVPLYKWLEAELAAKREEEAVIAAARARAAATRSPDRTAARSG